jgi:hypothetical protein
MTRDTGLLNDTELATVSGGAISLIATTGTLVLPHLPRDKDLLTPQQIAKILSFNGGFNPPVTNG